MTFRRAAGATVATLLLATGSPTVPGGIPPEKLFPGASFSPHVPSQAELLGFEPGERPLRHDELLRFFRELARRSTRADLLEYATTHEGRPMVVLAVSDQETLGRLDAFREEHARRLDPRGRGADEDRALLEQAKAVAFMAYGIHGDELSSVDAAAALAYWLVAGEDELAERMRRELVVLIDPCENPDGRERFLAQTAAFAHARPNPDTEDLSHTTVWPWGRGNHYLFDLNRDWFTRVQPESARSVVIASWNPQLMVDSHEMGADDTYLFSPPRHPFNPHLPPNDASWRDRFAADQARALDARGYAYYTREWNEEFFPGYGSSWAMYFGATGILYEMASTEGTLVRQRAGTLRHYAQAVEHQVTSSVANLTTLVDNRLEHLTDFVAARRTTIARAKETGVGAWILPHGRHPQRTDALVELLRAVGIEILRATSMPPLVTGLRDGRTGASVGADTLSADTWMIPLDQPAAAMVRVLLDPHVPMEAPFLREEREYLERGKGTQLYEVTAWSLPLAWDVEALWTAERPTTGWEDMPVTHVPGKVSVAEQTHGYLMEGTSDASVPALADLLQRGLAVRVAEKPFRAAGRDFDRGAVLVKVEGNPASLTEQLREVADRWSVRIDATPTAKAEQGPDLGGSHFLPLVAPRVGVFSGAAIAPDAYGALWHLLDRVVDLRFTGLDLGRFDRTDLARYNVLVFPNPLGGPGTYRESLGEQGIARLKTWIESGGTAIGIGRGAEFLADDKLALTRARLRHQALERYPPVVLGPSPELSAEAGLFRAVGLRAEPEPDKDAKDEGKPRRRERAPDTRDSPYDVAPWLGPGAKPFAERFAQGTPVDPRPIALADWLAPFLPPGKTQPDKDDRERADERLRRFGPRGAFLRVDLDPELWLTWGMGRESAALARGSSVLVAESPVEVPARFAGLERLHLGGLLWPEAAGQIARTAYLTRESVGRGQVVLFMHDPEFRGWTRGTRRLLLNAMLYGPGVGTDWSTPW